MTTLWSPRVVTTNDPNYSNARLRSSDTPIRDVITMLEGCGYNAHGPGKKKARADRQTIAHFGITEEELQVCKLIAALHYQDSTLYRANNYCGADKTPLRVMVDENLSYKIVLDLMTSGLNITHVSFERMNGLPDKDVWNKGANIIITHDDDFKHIATSMYLQRCIDRGSRHVDTSDFPLIILVNKAKSAKNIVLAAFRELRGDIIAEAVRTPRNYLYGSFETSGLLHMTSHRTVFENNVPTKMDDRWAAKCQEVIIDDEPCHLPLSVTRDFRKVAEKAKFSMGEFNAAARGKLQNPQAIMEMRGSPSDLRLLPSRKTAPKLYERKRA